MEISRVIIPIETKVREYHGKLLFSLVAAEKGLEVVLGGQKELNATIAQFSPCIYIDKSVAETKRSWFRHSRSMGNIMCAWDEEGLVVFNAEAYTQLRICRDLLDQTSCFFTWGKAQANAILSRIPEAEEKVRNTGNPRFDMLRPELRPFYKEAVDKLHKRFGRILLVNTNFAFANFFLGEEKVKEVYRAYTMPEDPDFFENWAETQRLSFSAFLEIIPTLSQRYPNHTIVIRPHPSESFAPWETVASNLPNVTVNGEDNVHEWILASDLLIHFNCTTGVEAYFLDVPAISYRMPGREAFHQPLPNELSLECKRPSHLLDLVDDILIRGHDFPKLSLKPERRGVERLHVTGMEGPFASERIVNHLLQLKSVEVPAIENPEPPIPLLKRGWRSILRLVRRPDPQDIAYQNKKFPGLELEEVQDCLARFQLITGRFDCINIRPLGPNCFHLFRS